MISKIMISLLSILCLCDLALAEPSPTMRYLMNEPVSRLDWGLYKLQSSLSNLKIKEEVPLLVLVNYNWDENRIEIFTLSSQTNKELNEVKGQCKEAINSLKKILGINPETGLPEIEKNSMLSHFFSHEGYQLKSEPENLSEELDKITKLYGRFFTKDKKGINCESTLLGTKILYAE